MTRYINSLGFKVRETINYRVTYLLDTDYNMIKFYESFEDRNYFYIQVVELGNEEKEAKTIILYNDEALKIYEGFIKAAKQEKEKENKVNETWKSF